MSISAAQPAISADDWLRGDAGPLQRYDVVGGRLTVRLVGGNPHHYLARRMAQAFESQWPGTTATAPGNWALTMDAGGGIILGRVPDVLVDGDDLLRSGVFVGVPDAVVEVWSPGNTLAEMNARRFEYREAGLPVLVEALLTDTGDVHLEWLTNSGERWTSAAAAIGATPLAVTTPRPFTVVPNDLIRRS